jgi:hypothetical protein
MTPVHATRLLCLLLSVLVSSGCWGRFGTAHTVFSVGTTVAALGEGYQNKACVWILGTVGFYRGMAVLVAQGDVTLAECQALYRQGVSDTPAPQ